MERTPGILSVTTLIPFSKVLLRYVLSPIGCCHLVIRATELCHPWRGVVVLARYWLQQILF